jgi:hypothetical protein
MKLEANKTYVFKDGTAETTYFNHSPGNKIYFQCFYRDGFTLETVLENNEGWINEKCVIGIGETQYFQLKETKMLKPDDKVTVEMTALELVKLRHLMDNVSGGHAVSFTAQLRNASPANKDRPSAADWFLGSDFHVWCLAQFQDPKQDRIDALKKTIADASAQIAAIKAESE